MAIDNSPRTRQANKIARKQGRRKRAERYLIICEGKKTEPLYFKELRKERRLSTSTVTIGNNPNGTCPKQLTEYAIKLFQDGDTHKGIKKKSFDRVFVVFDRDEHLKYDEALDIFNSNRVKLKNDEQKNVTFTPVTSIPCFEVWLLLHFKDVKSPMHREDVYKQLCIELPGYSKASLDTYTKTKDDIKKACERAEKLCLTNSPRTCPELYTNVHELVSLLTALGS